MLVVVIMAVDADVHAQDDDRNIIEHEMFCRRNYIDNFHMMSKMKHLVRKAHVPSLLCSFFLLFLFLTLSAGVKYAPMQMIHYVNVSKNEVVGLQQINPKTQGLLHDE